MKTISGSLILIIALVLTAGYGTGCSGNKGNEAATDTMGVADSVVQYFSQERLLKEVTFKDGVRNGLTKTYYPGGQLYQTFWYENGLKEDSAKWYYLEGPVFRSTPFLHDTIHGTQVQYYRNGKVKARLNYIKGLRTPSIEEYTRDGKPVTNYPDISYKLTDNYSTSGRVRVDLELTNQATKVKFYRGEFFNGVFDTTRIELIKTANGKASVELKKSTTPQQDYLGIIAEIITGFGNKYFAYKKIELPYRDLK